MSSVFQCFGEIGEVRSKFWERHSWLRVIHMWLFWNEAPRDEVRQTRGARWAEGSGVVLDVEDIGDVGGSQAMEGFEHQQCHFKINPGSDR